MRLKNKERTALFNAPFFKDYCTFENIFRQVQFLQLDLQFNTERLFPTLKPL